MSLFTQALAGAADAGSKVLNKYLDDEILRNRQQAFLDMQRQSASLARQDEDSFKNDPTRIERDRANKVADATAVGAATNQVRLEGDRALATDEGITAGQVARTTRVADANADAALRARRNEASDATITAGLVDRAKQTEQAGADVRLDAQKRALTELGGLEVDLAGRKADAMAKAQAKYREKPQGTPTPAEKLSQIRDALGRELTAQEKEALLGLAKADGNSGIGKLVNEATQKALEGGLIKPEEAGNYADKIKSSFVGVQVQAQMAPVVSKARKAGDMATLVTELTQQGFSPDQITGFGVTPDEFKAATAKPKAPGAQTSAVGGFMDKANSARLDYLRQLKASGRITPGDQAELDNRLSSGQ